MASINQSSCETTQAIYVNGVDDDNLANCFNSFFFRFERSDFLSEISMLRESLSLSPQNDIVITQENVTNLLKRVNIRKAAGPDSICGRTVRHCADQLSEVFTSLFLMCVESGQIPTIWKTSTIIPVPKISNPRELNEFRPVSKRPL